MPKYIYQYPNWPNFSWDDKVLNSVFGEVRHLQGKILGLMNSVGFTSKSNANLEAITLDVIKSAEIEGEKLDYSQVRSSIAKRLGIDLPETTPINRNVEGIVEMMLDANQNFAKPITEERLFAWHAALFPSGYSGMYKIEVAQYRTGEMQIVSGALGKQKVHYEAIPASEVKTEMDRLLSWVNSESTIDPIIKAAIAHFWFIIIHPLDDGNGRIARAITDLLLSRSEHSAERYYSLSRQIMEERKQYYAILQQAQHSDEDITDWLFWFLNCLKAALQHTELEIQKIFTKAKFWAKHENTILNHRQKLMLNKLLDGFEGKLKTSKWAKITKSSSDTALRDIKDLVEKDILQQEDVGGRSTNYLLVET